MSQIKKYELLVLKQIVNELHVLKLHALHHVFFFHGESFDVFNEIVAKEAVELSFCLFYFGEVFFGKTVDEIFSDYFASISDDIINKRIHQV